MYKIGFDDSIDIILKRDPRFHRDAYLFLRESLDLAVKSEGKERNLEAGRHVRGPQLLDGFRLLAIESFGPMAPTVLEEWGITQTSDIGDMVFNLIEEGSLSRTTDDSPEDFADIFDFHDAFVVPYLPVNQDPKSKRSVYPNPEGGALFSNQSDGQE